MTFSSSSDLRSILQRLLAGLASPEDVALLQQALSAGELTLATGDRSVAISGDANQAIIITGDNTQFILTAEALALLRQTPYQPPAKPEPGTLPLGSRLPFARNAVFTGRETDLLALADALLYSSNGAGIGIVQASAVATGLGGIGKSQLAVEFCYRYGCYFHGVHWLQANQDMHAEIAESGAKMGLRPWPEKQPEQVQVTLAAWGSGGQRLVVLDNAEDPAVVQEWLPQLGCAAVLLTARRAEWPVDLGLKQHPLDTLPRPESLALLRKLANRLKAVPDDELGQVADRLGDLPLALDLAGRYLKQRGRLSVAGYLKELEETGVLNNESLAGWTQYSPTKELTNLEATFQLSWARVKNDLAQRIFKVGSYCVSGVVIPWDVLKVSIREIGGIADNEFDRAVVMLNDLGLGGVSDAGLTLHLLLAEFGRKKDEESHCLRGLVDGLAELAGQANVSGYPAHFQPLRDHLQMAIQMANSKKIQGTGSLWTNLGYHFNLIAEYEAARVAHERAIAVFEFELGTDHPEVAVALNNLGLALKNMGDLNSARSSLERAIMINLAVFGSQHEKVATNINNLGGVLQDMGDLIGARKAYEEAIKMDEIVHGPNHPDVATYMDNLGLVLRGLGESDEARRVFERALAIDEAKFGPNHPFVARDIYNLGLVLIDLGDISSAHKAIKRAISVEESVFSLDHPDVGLMLIGLGRTTRDQGDHAGAKDIFQRALSIFLKNRLPNHHPYIQRVLSYLQSLSSDE